MPPVKGGGMESYMKKAESLYDTSWKLFRFFPNQIDAALAVQLLEQAKIPCYRHDGSVGVHLPGIGGSHVYVQACDLDEANRLLSDVELDPGDDHFEEEETGS